MNGVPVQARATDKYVNATALCKAGGKNWKDVERNREAQEFMASLAAKRRILPFDLIQKRRGAGGGTWVHPELAIRLCIWISGELGLRAEKLKTGRARLLEIDNCR